MADLRFCTAAAGFLSHADNNGAPVIGAVLNKIPDLLLFLLRGLFTEYSFSIPLKGFIPVFFPHGVVNGPGIATGAFQPQK